MENIQTKLRTIYPELTQEDFGTVIELRNDSDGRGDYIAAWMHPTLPQPSEDMFASVDMLPSAQVVKLAQINSAFTQAAAALTDDYPEAERMTWATQQSEALAWADDENTPTPYLDGLALARGIPAEEMRQKTLQQTQLFMQASQQLVGKRQRLRDAVYAAQTPEQLEDIKWEEDNNV